MTKRKYARKEYSKITHEEATATYHYDHETGHFFHKVRRSVAVPGTRADHPNQRGYLRISHNSFIYLAHRFAWFYVHGEWPAGQIDHINQVKTDNRMSNLRIATPAQNTANKFLWTRSVTHGRHEVRIPNILRERGKWRVRVGMVQIGTFESIHDAVAARIVAVEEFNQRIRDRVQKEIENAQ